MPGTRLSRWPLAHGRWLASQAFDHPAYQILLAEYCEAVEGGGAHLYRLNKLIGDFCLLVNCSSGRRLLGDARRNGADLRQAGPTELRCHLD